MWREQWDRVLRWYERVTAINWGRPHVMTSDHYQDELHAFFINCWHLKDWIAEDPNISITRDEVETFAHSTDNLKVCGDLCNGSKHAVLKPSRAKFDPNTKVGKRQFHVGLHAGGADQPTTIAVYYEIEAGGSAYDAFDVATGCMNDWDRYLRAKGLIP